MGAFDRWPVALRQRRHALLFVSLLATIAAGPVLSAAGFGGGVLELFLAVTLVAAVMPVRETGRRGFLLAVVLFALAVRHVPLRAIGGHGVSIGLGLWSAVALFAAYRALRYSMSSATVDSEHMFAALNAYLLVGVFGGAMCVALESAVPGSWWEQGKPLPDGLSMPDGIYFSFVTLATLGYGDIVPVSPMARGFAVFEAIAGQFYLAVLVGRLVGLRTARMQAQDGE
jgi:hypothetical protein